MTEQNYNKERFIRPVSLVIDGDTVIVKSPYNTYFVKNARDPSLDGEFKKDTKMWVFPKKNLHALKELLMYSYGYDGERCDQCDVLINIRYSNSFIGDRLKGSIEFLGIPIASARAKGGAIHVDEGVHIHAGGFYSGGSRENWKTQITNGTSLKVSCVPRAFLEDQIKIHKAAFEKGDVEVDILKRYQYSVKERQPDDIAPPASFTENIRKHGAKKDERSDAQLIERRKELIFELYHIEREIISRGIDDN